MRIVGRIMGSAQFTNASMSRFAVETGRGRHASSGLAKSAAVALLVLSLSLTISLLGLPAPAVSAAETAPVGANATFSARTVMVRIPTSLAYVPATKKTIVMAMVTAKVTARAKDGRVEVRVGNRGWRAVPYRYRPSSNTLVYDEAWRLRLGIRLPDPLGAPRPTYLNGAGGSVEPQEPSTPKPATYPLEDMTAVERSVFDRLNAERVKAGMAPAKQCRNLNAVAHTWTRLMGEYDMYADDLPSIGPDKPRVRLTGIVTDTSGYDDADGYQYQHLLTHLPGDVDFFSRIRIDSFLTSTMEHMAIGSTTLPDGSLSWGLFLFNSGACRN